MVTTGYDTVAIISGKIRIDPTTFTPTEWKTIIDAAIKELTIGYLSNLETIGQLLLPKRANEISTEYNIFNLLHVERSFDESIMHPDFLNLGTLVELPDWRSWPKASAHSDRYAELCETILTLRRGKHGSTHLVQVDIFWYLEESQAERRLQAKLIVMRNIVEIDKLFESLGTTAYLRGKRVLWQLYSAQKSTLANMNQRAAAAQEAAQKLESYLTRADIL
ncbi:MAG: hypothetical protein JWM39_348 [Parcubacteria group bacterium]|nr:hypothetical protein [Parcubacteria group bacterium]